MAENGSQEQEATEQLTPKQEMFLARLLTGMTITDAAAESGVAERTAYRWLHLSHFQEALRTSQKAIFDTTLDQLRLGVQDALKALKKHMGAEVEPTAATSLQAAKIWLEQDLQRGQMNELKEKILELEGYIKQLAGR